MRIITKPRGRHVGQMHLYIYIYSGFITSIVSSLSAAAPTTTTIEVQEFQIIPSRRVTSFTNSITNVRSPTQCCSFCVADVTCHTISYHATTRTCEISDLWSIFDSENATFNTDVEWESFGIEVQKTDVIPIPGFSTSIQIQDNEVIQAQAQADCESNGGTLVKIHDTQMVDFISFVLDHFGYTNEGFWTDGVRNTAVDQFVFTDGTLAPTALGTFWHSPPDDNHYPACVRLCFIGPSSSKWLWNDKVCTEGPFRSVCEYQRAT